MLTSYILRATCSLNFQSLNANSQWRYLHSATNAIEGLARISYSPVPAVLTFGSGIWVPLELHIQISLAATQVWDPVSSERCGTHNVTVNSIIKSGISPQIPFRSLLSLPHPIVWTASNHPPWAPRPHAKRH